MGAHVGGVPRFPPACQGVATLPQGFSNSTCPRNSILSCQQPQITGRTQSEPYRSPTAQQPIVSGAHCLLRRPKFNHRPRGLPLASIVGLLRAGAPWTLSRGI